MIYTLSKQLLNQLQKHVNTIVELKTQEVLKDSVISDLEHKLDEKRKDITRANNRVGEMRKLIVRYNESIFFKMFRGWLWLVDKYQHSRLNKILQNRKD